MVDNFPARATTAHYDDYGYSIQVRKGDDRWELTFNVDFWDELMVFEDRIIPQRCSAL